MQSKNLLVSVFDRRVKREHRWQLRVPSWHSSEVIWGGVAVELLSRGVVVEFNSKP